MSVWKYVLAVVDEQIVVMPHGAYVVLVGEQNGQLHLWALVNETAPAVRRRIVVCGTGQPVDVGLKHLGSAIVGEFVWHVFDGGSAA